MKGESRGAVNTELHTRFLCTSKFTPKGLIKQRYSKLIQEQPDYTLLGVTGFPADPETPSCSHTSRVPPSLSVDCGVTFGVRASASYAVR